jgi:hypothetical protein
LGSVIVEVCVAESHAKVVVLPARSTWLTTRPEVASYVVVAV